MLPDCDGFLPISSKLDYLYRFSRHLTHRTDVLTICLPPARWGPWALPPQCGGNIVRFRWISSNFVKTRLLTWNLTSHSPDAQSNPFLPPPRWGPRNLNCRCSGNIARFWQISSNLVRTQLFIQIYPSTSTYNARLDLCIPAVRWGPRALNSQCSGNIARFRWISSNHVTTRLFIQI